MKKTAPILFLLLSFFYSNAQKELWGYKVIYNAVNPEVPNGQGNDGMIIKVPLAGGTATAEIMHTFDVTSVQGKFPVGRLFKASNGKLYGVTSSYNDLSGGPVVEVLGVLFEYDLILNKYRVVATGLRDPRFGVIEPIPGYIYGTTNSGNAIFKYNIVTETLSIVAAIPSFSYNGSINYPNFNGELMKASDGYLYGVTDIAPTSQNVKFPGGIYKFNLATNQLTKLYVFNFTEFNVGGVIYPIYATKLIEGMPGKLYGTARGGNHPGPDGIAPLGSGTLYEYTIATNSLIKRYDFDYNSIGANPTTLVKGNNNKIYGGLYSVSDSSYPNSYGSIYEYDYTTSNLTVLRSFPAYNGGTENTHGISKVAPLASDGHFYGICSLGIFDYDPIINISSGKIISAYDMQELIEICRKPAYHEFIPDTYAPSTGSAFTYDIQNTNATTYVWKKGTTVLPLQTTAILNLPSITTADTGIYTCTMTNECGTTVTMNLYINVDNLGIDLMPIYKNNIILYPNPTLSILNIELPQSVEILKCFISNSLGQIVFKSHDNSNKIDVSNLQQGVYIVSLETNYGKWNGKFVKE